MMIICCDEVTARTVAETLYDAGRTCGLVPGDGGLLVPEAHVTWLAALDPARDGWCDGTSVWVSGHPWPLRPA